MVAFENVLHCLAHPSMVLLPCDLDLQVLGPALPALYPPWVQPVLRAGSGGGKRVASTIKRQEIG